METRVKIVLHGDTLLLAGLQASLAAYPEVEVLTTADLQLDAQTLRAWQPDVVIVDDAAPPALLRQLSMLSPGLLLVSVDSATNQIVLFSARQVTAASMHELIEFIGQHNQAQASKAPHSQT
jgi:DNA-binding NarL/FixJ family response regulator